MPLRYYRVLQNQPQDGVEVFLQTWARSVIKARTSGEGLDRETEIFKICGPSESRADGQWKLQSLKLNTLDLLPCPDII